MISCDICSMCSQLFSIVLWSLPYVPCLNRRECCYNFCVIRARHRREYVNTVERRMYSTFKLAHVKCLIYLQHNTVGIWIGSSEVYRSLHFMDFLFLNVYWIIFSKASRSTLVQKEGTKSSWIYIDKMMWAPQCSVPFVCCCGGWRGTPVCLMT